ncbi:MAG TPA: IS1595 family transposase [Bacteroidia bacterium]|nr:IS1595 family transposase [Bacteroidia bacterium]
MFKEFKNLHDIYTAFPDNDSCRKHLEQLRWNGNPTCPHCGSTTEPYKLKDGKTYECAEKKCRQKFTATVGTIFENTKVPLQKWFLAIYLASSHKKGISSLQLHRDIGVTQKTAWFMLHRIRLMLADKQPKMLSGVVEADEVYIGGVLKNKHKWQRDQYKIDGIDTKQPVLGILQRDGKIKFIHLKEVNRKVLIGKLKHYVKQGSVVITDSLPAYKSLKGHFEHHSVHHAHGEYARGIYHTNSIEGAFSLLQRGVIGIYHFVSPKHLHRYCSEFAFRYNTRKSDESERFNTVLSQVAGRLKYQDLINSPNVPPRS